LFDYALIGILMSKRWAPPTDRRRLIEGGQAFDLNGVSRHKAQASPR